MIDTQPDAGGNVNAQSEMQNKVLKRNENQPEFNNNLGTDFFCEFDSNQEEKKNLMKKQQKVFITKGSQRIRIIGIKKSKYLSTSESYSAQQAS